MSSNHSVQRNIRRGRQLNVANEDAATHLSSNKRLGKYYGTATERPAQQSGYKESLQQTDKTCASKSGEPSIRQHQQNVEVVDVPDAGKFFTYNITTRKEILSKLNLNSLTEYIEHLEEYRCKNRDKVDEFHKRYLPVIKAQQIRDPDLDKQDIVDPITQLNEEVNAMLVSIEKKLESLQLQRMMTKEVETFSDPSEVNGHPVIAPEEMEIIDLTFRKEMLPQKQLNSSGEEQTKEFAMLNDDDSIQIATKPSINGYENVLLNQMQLTSKKQHQQQPTQSSSSLEAKISLGGFQLPLPKVFNQLSQMEKNLLMCKLPEVVRGQYLSMCWESRFYQQLAEAPLGVQDQLLLNLNF